MQRLLKQVNVAGFGIRFVAILRASCVFFWKLAKMQTTSLSTLIVVALLCACNGVFGSWIPTSKMTAQTDLDGRDSDRKFLPRDEVTLNSSLQTHMHARKTTFYRMFSRSHRCVCSFRGIFLTALYFKGRQRRRG